MRTALQKLGDFITHSYGVKLMQQSMENQAGLQWLGWAQRLQAIAQNGLTYTENPYDVERFHQIQAIASE